MNNEDPKSPIDAILNSFTTQTKRTYGLAYFPWILLILGVGLFILHFKINEGKTEVLYLYLALAALIGSVVTYFAVWYYNLRMSNVKADIIRGYLSMVVDRLLPKEAKFQAVETTIDSIIRPLLGLKSEKKQE